MTGFDISGRVLAIGKGVKDFKVGDEIFGYLNINSNNGGNALQQYSVEEICGLIRKPASLTHTDAATRGLAFLTAMDDLRQLKIDSSTSVLIRGGSDGVGHFSVPIAHIRGAKQVITSASKEDEIRILKDQYHTKDVINHDKEDIVNGVFELTEGEGADVVYDLSSRLSNFEKTIKTMEEGDSWVVPGDFGEEGSSEARSVAERTQSNTFGRDALAQETKWTEEAKVKPYINEIIKLEEAEDALYRLKEGKSGFGKIVVKLL